MTLAGGNVQNHDVSVYPFYSAAEVQGPRDAFFVPPRPRPGEEVDRYASLVIHVKGLRTATPVGS